MRIDSDEFVCHPVVLAHVQGVHGRQTGLLVDTAVTWKNQNMLLLLLSLLLWQKILHRTTKMFPKHFSSVFQALNLKKIIFKIRSLD